MTAPITRAEIEELRRRVAEAHERERAGIVGSITVRLRLAERLLDAADERDRLRALLAEFKSALGPVPGWPESSTARDLRARVEAELGCGQAVVAHETPEGDGR